MASKKKPNGYWTKEKCYEVAHECSSKVEFKKNYYGAYQKSCVMGWISDYTWFVRPVVHNKMWTKDTCYEEATKYHSRDEFKQGNNGAYQAAQRSKWLDDYYWFSESKTAKKWTYETCYEEAKKYSSKSEFQKGNGSAYGVARENGWLDDYIWFDELKKPNGYWNNYDHCYEEAKKYKTKVDFHEGCSRAYNVAYKNKWIYDYTWFEEKSKPNGYWDDYDNCYEEAKKYSISSQFQKKAQGAYIKAKQNGWLKDYTWFLSEFEARSAGTKGNNVKCATYEECYEEALKYTCRRDFCHYSGTAWKHAKDNGWIDDYTWFKTPCPFGRNDFVVYAYRDYENKVVYVGLTGDIDGRHSGHKCGRKKKGSIRYDTLMRYFISVGKELPKPIIHMDGLTPNEAQYYEDWYRKAYANNGWRVLNIAPTGEGVSSIGGHPSKFVK